MDDYTIDENGAILIQMTGGGILPDHQHAAPGDGGALAVGVTLTDLTQGSIWFAGVGGLLQEDNANLFWDDGNNRLGVGTLTPDYQVDIENLAADPILRLNSASGDNTIIYLTEQNVNLFGGRIEYDGANNYFEIGTIDNSVDIPAIYIPRTTGDVGVNVPAPSRKFHAMDDSASTNVILPIARIESQVSGGAGAAGHGPGLDLYGESDSTENQPMGQVAATWETPTHASRRAQLRFFADLQGTLHPVGVIVAPNTAPGAIPAVNAWGAGAVDFQTFRNVATEVASGIGATIGGGTKHTASGQEATVAGGRFCQATGDWATVTGGGDAGLVTPNLASGDYSTVCGGESGTASGDHSWCAGQLGTASHTSSYVWSSAAATVSWGNNTWTARTHGGARFYSAAGVGTGVQLTAGGNAWAAISARAAKRDLRPVEGVLAKVAQLPIYNYNLKSQPETVRHIGAVAEEFNEIFGFTEAEGYINSMDVSGIALAAIKALLARMEKLEMEVLQ